MQRRDRMFSEQAGPQRHIRRSCGSHGDQARRVRACKEGGDALDPGVLEGSLEQRALEPGALEESLMEEGALEQGALEPGALEQRAPEHRGLEEDALEQHALDQGAPEGAPEGLRKQQR